MNRIIAICLLTLISCQKEKPIRELVVTALFKSDATPELQIFYADDGGVPSMNEVNLFVNNNAYALHQNGSTFVNPALTLQAEDTLRLECQTKDYIAKAWTRIPPAISITSVSNTSITINPNSTGSPALVVQWTALPEEQYSYVLQLESMNVNPAIIPFSVPAGRFSAQYSGPITQTGTIIFDTDFKYYGSHRLTVYAIRKEFERMYFYDKSDLRGLALLSPDNILNAKGFVTAVSSTSVDLEIQ